MSRLTIKPPKKAIQSKMNVRRKQQKEEQENPGREKKLKKRTGYTGHEKKLRDDHTLSRETYLVTPKITVCLMESQVINLKFLDIDGLDAKFLIIHTEIHHSYRDWLYEEKKELNEARFSEEFGPNQQFYSRMSSEQDSGDTLHGFVVMTEGQSSQVKLEKLKVPQLFT